MSIQGNFVLLMQNLDVEAILPYLKQAKMVTYTEYEQVSNPNLSLKQKRDKLLLLLTRKGPNHFVQFSWCVVWSGQRGLAEKMQVDLSSVPKSIDDVFPAVIPCFSSFPGGCTTQATEAGTSNYPNPPLPVQGASQLSAGHTSSDPSSTIARTHPLNVLLLYCKDPELAHCTQLDSTHWRSEDQYCEEMLCLADTLCKFSVLEGEDGQPLPGFTCAYDGYDDGTFVDNWLRWTETRLREADCVLLACSPTLHSSLLSSSTIHMQRALCAVNSLINTMQNKPFYPIFLNMPILPDWIPTQLKNSSCFQLSVSAFHSAIGDIDGLDEDSFFRRAYHCFDSDTRFRDLLSLLKMLRREFIKPPEPPNKPVPLPSPPSNIPRIPGSISEDTLQKIAENVALRWQELGIQLGIPYLDLERIRMENSHNLVARVMAIFHKWQASKGPLATGRVLRDALINLRYAGIASRFFPSD